LKPNWPTIGLIRLRRAGEGVADDRLRARTSEVSLDLVRADLLDFGDGVWRRYARPGTAIGALSGLSPEAMTNAAPRRIATEEATRWRHRK
jgi:hypothetical protein